MSILDFPFQLSSPQDRHAVEKALKEVWNTAIERASDVALHSYYEDDKGSEPMSPSTIGERILDLKKA